MFKQCPMCNTVWETRDEFLNDPTLKVIGYQVNFKFLENGLFLFNHDCDSTLAIEAKEFMDLNTEPKVEGCKAQLPGCPLYCIDEKQLSRCDQICECAFVRNILSIIPTYK